MNARQEAVVRRLRTDILEHDGYDSDYEYKRFEVSEHNWNGTVFVEVLSEVGLKDDEGTMAAILARTRRQIFVGPRGGCRLANATTKSWPNGYWNAVHSVTK